MKRLILYISILCFVAVFCGTACAQSPAANSAVYGHDYTFWIKVEATGFSGGGPSYSGGTLTPSASLVSIPSFSNLSTLQVGDIYFASNNAIYEITAATINGGGSSATVDLELLNDPFLLGTNVVPSGEGVVARPSSNGLVPPYVTDGGVSGGIGYKLEALMANYNYSRLDSALNSVTGLPQVAGTDISESETVPVGDSIHSVSELDDYFNNTISVTDTAHGYSAGDLLYWNGTTRNLAGPGSDEQGQFVVSEVIDANSYKIARSGDIVESFPSAFTGDGGSITASGGMYIYWNHVLDGPDTVSSSDYQLYGIYHPDGSLDVIIGDGGGGSGGGSGTDDQTAAEVSLDPTPLTIVGSSVTTAQAALEAIEQNLNIHVSTISDLKAYDDPYDGIVAFVDGYYSAGDGGGGIFWYNSISVLADNGGSIIEPTFGGFGGTGRWERVRDQHTSLLSWGAVGDGVTNDLTAFVNYEDYVFANELHEVYIPSAPTSRYLLEGVSLGNERLYRNITYRGDGWDSELYIKQTRGEVWHMADSTNGLTIRDLSILSHVDEAYITGGVGGTIFSDNGDSYSNLTLDNVRFHSEAKQSTAGNTLNGVHALSSLGNGSGGTSSNVRITNCHVDLYGSNIYGFRFLKTNDGAYVVNNTVILRQTGDASTPSSLNHFAYYGSSTNGYFANNKSYCFPGVGDVNTSHSAYACSPCENTVFENNYVEGVITPTEAGIENEFKSTHNGVRGPQNVTFRGNEIVNCYWGGAINTRDSIEGAFFPYNTLFEGNTYRDCLRIGVGVGSVIGSATPVGNPPQVTLLRNERVFDTQSGYNASFQSDFIIDGAIGITMEGCESYNGGNCGVQISSGGGTLASKDVYIKDCKFISPGFRGIYVQTSQSGVDGDFVVSDCTIDGGDSPTMDFGIVVNGTTTEHRAKFDNNVIRNFTGFGIFYQGNTGQDGVRITNNFIIGNGAGTGIQTNCNNATVSLNTTEDVTTGVTSSGTGGVNVNNVDY